MKKFFALLCLCLATAVSAQTVTTLKLDKESHDFGTIPEKGGKVSTKFTAQNAGKYPLVITRVVASCGCTTPKWTQEPIMPGKSGEINVTFDPDYRPGTFVKSVTIYANIEEGYQKVTIKGDVKPAQ